MEKFGFNKGWKVKKFMGCGYPVIGLLAILALGIFVVLPSKGEAFRYEFKWWMPLFAVGLIVWAIIEINNFRKVLRFSVELSEESIRVAGEEVKWEDISRIEVMNGILIGDKPAMVMHTKPGTVLKIPFATESIQFVMGFVQGHAKNVSRS